MILGSKYTYSTRTRKSALKTKFCTLCAVYRGLTRNNLELGTRTLAQCILSEELYMIPENIVMKHRIRNKACVTELSVLDTRRSRC